MKSILGGLAPLASNPVTLTVIGVGAAAWAIANIFDEDKKDDDNGSNAPPSRNEPFNQPLNGNRLTVQSARPEPFNLDKIDGGEPFESPETGIQNSKHEQPHHELEHNNTTLLVDEEAAKKEMIRKTMSELGKRSGAARRKKAETSETSGS